MAPTLPVPLFPRLEDHSKCTTNECLACVARGDLSEPIHRHVCDGSCEMHKVDTGEVETMIEGDRVPVISYDDAQSQPKLRLVGKPIGTGGYAAISHVW